MTRFYVEEFSPDIPESLWPIALEATRQDSLDAVYGFLRKALPDWFIYQGGGHVAVHRKSGAAREILIVEGKAP